MKSSREPELYSCYESARRECAGNGPHTLRVTRELRACHSFRECAILPMSNADREELMTTAMQSVYSQLVCCSRQGALGQLNMIGACSVAMSNAAHRRGRRTPISRPTSVWGSRSQLHKAKARTAAPSATPSFPSSSSGCSGQKNRPPIRAALTAWGLILVRSSVLLSSRLLLVREAKSSQSIQTPESVGYKCPGRYHHYCHRSLQISSSDVGLTADALTFASAFIRTSLPSPRRYSRLQCAMYFGAACELRDRLHPATCARR